MDTRAALVTGGALAAAAQIGRFTGTISPATAAMLVLAALLSVVLFPGTALTFPLATAGRCPDD
jgi:hypothetical protein